MLNAVTAILWVTAFQPEDPGSIVLFESDDWHDIVGEYATIHFDEVPADTQVTDQYQESHGVVFADGADWTREDSVFVTDGYGLDGITDCEVLFGSSQFWIAVDYPGGIGLELFWKGDTIYEGSFIGSGSGHFAGVVLTEPFDAVRLYDPLGHVHIDNLHFGAPNCDEGGVAGWSSPPSCPGDVNWDRMLDVDDLIGILVNWGPCPPDAFCIGDADFDCVVGVDDLLEVLLGWGPCIDCNANGVPDDVDIAVGTSTDCDDNDVPDECDIVAVDCNGNGRPDACDATFGFEVISPPLSPIGTGSPQIFTVLAAPRAVGDVALRVTAFGDFEGSAQSIHVSLNGVLLDTLFVGGAIGTCDAWSEYTFLSANDYNEITAGGSASFLFETTPWVDPSACEGSWVSVRVRYPTAELDDCNGNGVPDGCDVADGTSVDLDGDGIPNECQVAPDDCDHDGVPDERELAGSDCNDNGVPDLCDVSFGYRVVSPPLGPDPDGLQPVFIVADPPVPVGPVTIFVAAVKEFNAYSGDVDVLLNGVDLGPVIQGWGLPCPDPPAQGGVQIPAATFVEIVGPADAEITVVTYLGDTCGPSTVTVALAYLTADLQDCNGNGVPDACDIADGASVDLDGDGVPDEC